MSRLARQLGRVKRSIYGLLESEMSVMPWVLPFLARRPRLASRAPRHCRLEGYPLLRYAQLHTAVGAYSYTLSRLCCISFTGWDMLQDNLQATTACHSAIQTDWFGTVLRVPPSTWSPRSWSRYWSLSTQYGMFRARSPPATKCGQNASEDNRSDVYYQRGGSIQPAI